LGKANLKELRLCGVFQQRETRRALAASLKAKGINLVLFEPSYTDESSQDNTEDESQVDEESVESGEEAD